MSDDDIESQLLAVVGVNKEEKSGSKSSKKKAPKRRKKKKESSDEEGEIEESEEDPIEEAPSKPLKKRKTMDEEDFSEEEKFDDGFEEDLKGDAKDREYLDSLPEVEREQILADRYQKRQELQERFKLKQKLRREKEMKDGKRRTPSRTKVEKGNKTSALNDLKKKRARANQTFVEESSESEEIKDEPEDSDEDYLIKEDKERGKKSKEEDVSMEEAQYKEEPKQNLPEQEAARPVNLEELLSISLKRDFIERKIEEPYFDTLVKDCFVRIGIGMHNERPVYRVAQITEVKEGPKKYKIGKHKTNKVAVLKHGTSSKTFLFDCVSNHRVQESEFKKWLSEMEKGNQPVITNKRAAEKNKELKESRFYVYTKEDVAKMVEHKKELKGKPTNIAAEKVRLTALRDACKDAEDTEEMERLQHQIDELDQMTKEGKTTFDKAFWINQRNQQTNQARSDVSEIRGAYFTAHPELDPFSRRQTKPTNVMSWLLKEREGSTGEEPKEEKKPSANAAKKEDENKNGSTTPKVESEVDPETLLKQAHDFDLILDAPPEAFTKQEPREHKPEQPKVEKKKQKRPTLSVEDYKRRMGLI